MTISAPYEPSQNMGNGTSKTFAVTFPFAASGDLAVELFNTDTGQDVSPAPVLNGAGTYDYSVSGTAESGTGIYPSGSVVFNNAPLSNHEVIISRATPQLQETSMTDNARFPAKAVEGALDRLEMQVQEYSNGNTRAMRAPASDVSPNLVLPAAAARANLPIVFDQHGDVAVAQISFTAVSEPVGTRATLVLTNIPSSVLAVTTTGYSTAGDFGAASYKRVNSAPSHPGYFQSADGAYWELVGPTVRVEQLGAKGDNATNDVASFQAAFQVVHAWGGGRVQYGAHGRIYRVGYTSSYPALVMGSHTTFERVGGGYINLDASTLPVAPAAPGAYGEITTGDPVTLARAGVTSGSTTDGFIIETLDAATIVSDVHVIDPDIRCTFVGTLPSGKLLNGISIWFGYDCSIRNGYCDGIPNTGFSFSGGSRNRMINPTARNCGFGASGFSRNGIHMTGYMVLSDQTLTSQSFFVDNAVTEYHHDEGVQWAGCGRIFITKISGKGCQDKLIEGDTAYTTTHVKGDVINGVTLKEIPCEVNISEVNYDGLYSDGTTKGKWGVAINCGNQGRVNIGKVRIRNTAVNSPVLVAFSNNGRIAIEDVTIEDCSVDPNFHFVYAAAEQVRIGRVTVVSPAVSSSSNQAVVSVQNARLALIDDVQSDSGPVIGVALGGSNAADDIQVNNLRLTGSNLSAISFGMTGHVKNFVVSNCDCRGINAANDSDAAFVLFNGNPNLDYFRCEGNRGQYSHAPEHPITTNGSGGSITAAHIIHNELGSPALAFSPGSFGVGSITVTDLRDYDNGIPGQRIYVAAAAPLSGTWGVGDQVISNGPVAGTNIGWVCTAAGTPGTWKTFGAIAA